MGTVVEVDGVRIFINSRDHGPAHAHVRGADWEIRVYIGGEARLWNIKNGNPTNKAIKRAVAQVGAHLEACDEEWRRLHG